jgi:hypothetical protein
VALLEKRRYLNNRSGDFPQVILIVPSHVPNTYEECFSFTFPSTIHQTKFATLFNTKKNFEGCILPFNIKIHLLT